MSNVIGRLFPTQFDNRYDGQRAALWLLGLLVALRLVMGVNSIFNTESVAVGADGFPLDSYGPDAAHSVLMLFALNAAGQLTIAAFALLALVRYRAMVPAVYLILAFDQLVRRSLLSAWAVERSEAATPGVYIGWGLLLLPVAGLILSLWPRRTRGAGLRQS